MPIRKDTKTKKAPQKSTKKTAPKKIEKDEDTIAGAEEHDEEIAKDEVEDDGEVIALKGKSKKVAEVDAADILPEVDEKIEDDEHVTIPGFEDEESDDLNSGLDDEDLNPFGDKWEE